MSSHIIAFDVWFENLMLPIRTPFFVQMFGGVTFFGSALTVAGLAGLIGLTLFFFKMRRAYVAGLVTTLLGAVVSVYALKVLVARARPDGLLPAISENSFSFPSWHATAAVAFYGFVAFLFCRLYPEYKKTVMIATVLLIFLIGFSRLYLGVHFPSDVIAGYMLGGLWLSIGIWVTNRFDKTIVIG